MDHVSKYQIVITEKGMWMYLVLETGETEVKKIKQAVDLWHRQVWDPALQQLCVCILQHPQETNQQCLAALCREHATLTARLMKKQTKTHLHSRRQTQQNRPIRHHIQQPVWDRHIQRTSLHTHMYNKYLYTHDPHFLSHTQAFNIH